MSELIIPQKPKGFKKMSIVFGNGKNTNSRNSRDVWKYLGVKTGYARWINRRIKTLNAEENVDFVVGKNAHEDFTNIEYIVTDDFAKHLGMMEKTPKGKEVRNYFIYMEKIAKYLILETCSRNQIQLETAQQEIKLLRVKSMKTYKDGFMSLGKYLKQRNINMTKETAWEMLTDFDIVKSKDVLTHRKILNNDHYGRQIDYGVIEFNSRALDEVFDEFVANTPTLF